MKALVAVKRVVDPNVTVRLKADGSDVETANVKHAINPFDENALEEAVRLKEAGTLREIVAVAFGPKQAQDTLRHALAMGADRVIHVETEQALEPLAVAKLLKTVVEREQPRLVLLGKQAIDDDAGQTAQMLAALLGWGQGVAASALALTDAQVEVTREIDGGTETVTLTLPAVISADLRLNEPRYVKLPNLMMAKKKPIEALGLDALGGAPAPRVRVLKVAEPPPRSPGIRVANVDELLEKLRSEAKVLS